MTKCSCCNSNNCRKLIHLYTGYSSKLRTGYPYAFGLGEERTGARALTCPFFSLTSQERNATHESTRQSATLAPWVSRLLVRSSCRLMRPFVRSKPPTVHTPYVACRPTVPRFISRDRVPP